MYEDERMKKVETISLKPMLQRAQLWSERLLLKFFQVTQLLSNSRIIYKTVVQNSTIRITPFLHVTPLRI